jgi:hypothetical protein
MKSTVQLSASAASAWITNPRVTTCMTTYPNKRGRFEQVSAFAMRSAHHLACLQRAGEGQEVVGVERSYKAGLSAA